jgi:uncharacterized membrane protein YoaK (UPF0700 family)
MPGRRPREPTGIACDWLEAELVILKRIAVRQFNLVPAHYALTLIAGWVDAVGYLSLKGFFVSFMSGNTTQLGLNVGAGDVSGIATAAILISSFIAGGFLGAVISAAGKSRDAIILAVEGLFILGAVAIAHRIGAGIVFAALLALSMGLQNAAAASGPVSAGLTYVTGTLVKVGQELGKLAVGLGSVGIFLGNLASWIALLIGVVLGASAHEVAGTMALLIPSVMLLGLACALQWGVARQKRLRLDAI